MSTQIRPPTAEEWLAIERDLHERPSDTPSPSTVSGFLKFNVVSAFPVPSYRSTPLSSASSSVGAGCDDSGFMDVFEDAGQLDSEVSCVDESAGQSNQMQMVEDQPRFQCTTSSTIVEASSCDDNWQNWFKHMGSDMGKILSD